MADRPVIGVTGADNWLAWGWWAAAVALFLVGAKPVHLTPKRGKPRTRLDAIVIGGGDDIDSALYGDDNFEPPDPERDAYEIEMLKLAETERLPVLGICRGAQLINVVAGGNLHADIRSLRRITSNRPSIFPLKTVDIKPDTRLSSAIDRSRVKVNSLHSQAVNRLGHDIFVVARDLDRIPQAIEQAGERFCLGTQWHPEYLLWRRVDRSIFRALVSAARERRKRIAS